MVSHQNGAQSRRCLPRCSDIRPNGSKGIKMTDTFIQERDVNEYIPGIATACWVPSDKVQEGDRIGCSSGVRSWFGKPVPMMQTVGAQCGGSGAKLPLCMCACMYTLSVYLRWITGLYEPSRS
jgi:hypothetical protein